ncbi:MAG: 50S ribosomal protein L19 [Bacteroidota bacterium]|nr:50S ribosomal protein L19 [Bacteroidota bacterium]
MDSIKKEQGSDSIIRKVTESFSSDTTRHPDFSSGDTITVYYTISEGNKERAQAFKGVVIQRKGIGATATFTVRKYTSGIGVERIFPISSPLIEKIEVNKHGRVRRSRIYYFKNLKGKKAKIKERKIFTKNK